MHEKMRSQAICMNMRRTRQFIEVLKASWSYILIFCLIEVKTEKTIHHSVNLIYSLFAKVTYIFTRNCAAILRLKYRRLNQTSELF